MSGGTSGDQATRPSPSSTTRPVAAAPSMSAHTGQRLVSSKARSRASRRGGSRGSPTSWACVCCRDAPAAAPWFRKRNGQSPRGSASTAAMRSAQTPPASSASSSVRSPKRTTCRGVFTMTSCTPSSGATAGNLFGIARTSQPGVSGPPPPGRTAWVSGGVSASLPSQKGQPTSAEGRPTSCGRAARAGARRTGSPVSGSRRIGLRTPSGGAGCRTSWPAPWRTSTTCRPRRRP